MKISFNDAGMETRFCEQLSKYGESRLLNAEQFKKQREKDIATRDLHEDRKRSLLAASSMQSLADYASIQVVE